MVSRNVLRVDIPPTATPIRTPVVFKDPSLQCFNQGNGKVANGWCADCGQAKAAASNANIAAYAAIVTARQADVMKAQHGLQNAIAARNTLQATKPNSTDLANAIQAVKAAEDSVNSANAALVAAQAVVQAASAPAAPTECECSSCRGLMFTSRPPTGSQTISWWRSPILGLPPAPPPSEDRHHDGDDRGQAERLG